MGNNGLQRTEAADIRFLCNATVGRSASLRGVGRHVSYPILVSAPKEVAQVQLPAPRSRLPRPYRLPPFSKGCEVAFEGFKDTDVRGSSPTCFFRQQYTPFQFGHFGSGSIGWRLLLHSNRLLIRTPQAHQQTAHSNRVRRLRARRAHQTARARTEFQNQPTPELTPTRANFQVVDIIWS